MNTNSQENRCCEKCRRKPGELGFICTNGHCSCHSSSTETNYLEVGTHVHCFHCHYTILRENALEHFDLHRESKPTPCESVLNCPRLVTPPEKEWEPGMRIFLKQFMNTCEKKCDGCNADMDAVIETIRQTLTSHTEQIAREVEGMKTHEGSLTMVYLTDVLKIIRGKENEI